MAKHVITHPDGTITTVETPLGSPTAKLGILGFLLSQYPREYVEGCRIQPIAAETSLVRDSDWVKMVEVGKASGLKVIR